jgi:hypothetical protein
VNDIDFRQPVSGNPHRHPVSVGGKTGRRVHFPQKVITRRKVDSGFAKMIRNNLRDQFIVHNTPYFKEHTAQ